jgi:hypothetical protein
MIRFESTLSQFVSYFVAIFIIFVWCCIIYVAAVENPPATFGNPVLTCVGEGYVNCYCSDGTTTCLARP